MDSYKVYVSIAQAQIGMSKDELELEDYIAPVFQVGQFLKESINNSFTFTIFFIFHFFPTLIYIINNRIIFGSVMVSKLTNTFLSHN